MPCLAPTHFEYNIMKDTKRIDGEWGSRRQIYFSNNKLFVVAINILFEINWNNIISNKIKIYYILNSGLFSFDKRESIQCESEIPCFNCDLGYRKAHDMAEGYFWLFLSRCFRGLRGWEVKDFAPCPSRIKEGRSSWDGAIPGAQHSHSTARLSGKTRNQSWYSLNRWIISIQLYNEIWGTTARMKEIILNSTQHKTINKSS